jgi:hypothetical protein
MFEDCVISVFLLLVAALARIVRGRGHTIRPLILQALKMVRSVCDAKSWRRAWQNPLQQLVILLLLLLGAGWVATLSQVGFAETKRAVNFKRPTQRPKQIGSAGYHETQNCHGIQRMVVKDIGNWAESEGRPIRPGPIDPHYGWDCQFGGSYFFDDFGRLQCTRHGSASDNPPVSILPIQGNDS